DAAARLGNFLNVRCQRGQRLHAALEEALFDGAQYLCRCLDLTVTGKPPRRFGRQTRQPDGYKNWYSPDDEHRCPAKGRHDQGGYVSRYKQPGRVDKLQGKDDAPADFGTREFVDVGGAKGHFAAESE